MTINLKEGLRGAQITCLLVDWTGSDRALYQAKLPVHVAQAADLLPPAEFQNLTAAAIIECLISGRDPAEWGDGNGKVGPKNRGSDDAAIDSLQAIDTEGYMLYRTRRLGRALATLGERILKTVRSTDAISYRLFSDPFGPMALAGAVQQEWEPAVCSVSKRSEARTVIVFAIAEIALTMAHVARRLDIDRQRGEPDLSPCFRQLITQLEAQIQDARSDAEAGVCEYAASVKSECERLLLGTTPSEVLHAS